VKVNADEKVESGESVAQDVGLVEEHAEVDETDDGVALAQPEIESEVKEVELTEGHEDTENDGDGETEEVALSVNKEVDEMVMPLLPVLV